MKSRHLFVFINNLKFLKKASFSGHNVKPVKVYPLNTYEDDFYKVWCENGDFLPKHGGATFSMLLPPPNVTGHLHLGHALTVTIQDVITRWRRMCGDEVLWIPGIDHAGIATQVVVEKYLERQGISRESIGRDHFLEEVWKWTNLRSSVINSQLKTLGSFLDWSRHTFTMDSIQSKAVVDALFVLWERGLIYRDEILVNWSPRLQSVISDIEVNHVEIKEPTKLSLPGYSRPIEFGNITDFAYKVAGSDEEIVVSTTRIETMLGDVAVAVNPNDQKYRHLWGSVLLHPFTGLEIPLILDYNVDPNFGTGALKVTPGHDRIDFLIGKNHGLSPVSVINEEGVLENCGQFSGLKRFDAREAIINALSEKGLLRGVRPHKMSVPLCSRTGDVIELLIKPQWFIKCKGMADRAILAVKQNQLKISPEKYCSDWFNWLGNIQDWCISRQLWWGHQIPFYNCKGSGKEIWFPARNQNEAEVKAKTLLLGDSTVTRDVDVLDTWFSSALLPFTCFGWPDKTVDLQRYYPLNTVITGNDILFFWVARMVMLGLELTNELPFKEVFLHGIICDSQGRKMSKSLGNVINPEDIIKGKPLQDLQDKISESLLSKNEIKMAKDSLQNLFPKGIPECGVDALRFTLLTYNIKNQYINFNVKDCESTKRFCNKLWQAFNFMNKWVEIYSLSEVISVEPVEISKNLMDNWILSKLNVMIAGVNSALIAKDFHLATAAIRDFIHHDLCDIYIESVKPLLKDGEKKEIINTLSTLNFVLESSIKCLGPFMPFVAEHLYQLLPGTKCVTFMDSGFPSATNKNVDNSKLERVSLALDIVGAIRKIKHDAMINTQKTKIWLSCDMNIDDIKQLIECLAKCSLEISANRKEIKYSKKELVNENISVFVNLDDIQLTKEVNLVSIVKRKDKIEKKLQKLLSMTSNVGYEKASEEVKKSHREKILILKNQMEDLESRVRN